MVLASAVMLALLAWSATQLQQAARDDMYVRAQGTAQVAARQHAQLFASARGWLVALSRSPQLHGDAATCQVFLQQLQAAHPEYLDLGVAEPDGRVRCATSPGTVHHSFAAQDYFQRALASREFAASEYRMDNLLAAPNISFGYPIVGAAVGTDAPAPVVGVVFVVLPADWVATLNQSSALPVGSTVKLFDHRLHLLARYPALPATAGNGSPEPGTVALPEAVAAHPDGGVFSGVGLDGEPRLYAYIRLEGAIGLERGSYLMLGMPLSGLQTRLDSIVMRQMTVVLIAFGVLVALAWTMLNWRVVAPTRRLALAAARLATGEQGVRLGQVGGAAEFQTLALAFDDVATRTDAAVRALTVLSAGNRAMAREPDEQALLEAMCQVAVEAGGYRYARVTYATPTGVQQMAEAGNDGGFAAFVQTCRDPTALAQQTPLARTIASGEPVVVSDAAKDTGDLGLFQAATLCGLRSGLGLPLRLDGSILGAFSLYGAEPDMFGPREVSLLSQIADDLSFGIANARLRVQHAQAAGHVQRLAYFDAVTGLPNRTGFLEHAPARSGAETVLAVDIHNYWEVAATLGQACGDELLRVVAERLQALSPVFLARIAQSEFGLLLASTDEVAARSDAQQALDNLAAPALLSQVSADIRATVGIALPGGGRSDRLQLLQAARLAAREALKSSSKLLLAHRHLEHEWAQRLALVVDLRIAIEQHQVRLHVQPQIDLHTGRVCGMEALARWQHPTHGDVPPGRFVALAEQTGLIRPLTYAVLEAAREIAAQHAAAGMALPIAVNISAHNLHDPEFVARVTQFLERWPLPRDCLHLELTETALMEDPVLSLRVLGQLRTLGLPIYLDDFGSGYSSLAYLRELPLHGIKIDRAFIVSLAQPGSERIVQKVIELGHALELRVVAEGVEDQATLDLLAALGCDVAQGYVIARPMPSTELAAWMQRWPGQRVNQGVDRRRRSSARRFGDRATGLGE